ncbi:MAG: hypothetical protein A3J62_01265 [Candidatus Buchananbacteria bacterium RIFCSPHIGHO2_02_FULL_38_8]|uniref:Uncharacterized protein n=2 Tax=Candidatus Buchananiibacteriota TaxID=1817903 RepID=A0A1G1XUR1_9BACT|nr:MAG: hypothetical protein A2731_00480 [Candidatus Buchananbacteria bacterium RIFCSPHIGHO2_01_FULL_39_8]OGY46982.1 MAG: hypothetical protein A3J62_01265 [Candidatus Buchananbacteria bacterium RIFCSPHIGHO2_02_FULL_38_8]
MVASPVLMQAEHAIRPGFERALLGRKIPSDAEFRLVSEPLYGNGTRKYSGVALIPSLGCRADQRKSRAVLSLRRAFDRAKTLGQIPQSAEFEVIEVREGGKTLRWVGARVDAWGTFVGKPTISD